MGSFETQSLVRNGKRIIVIDPRLDAIIKFLKKIPSTSKTTWLRLLFMAFVLTACFINAMIMRLIQEGHEVDILKLWEILTVIFKDLFTMGG